MGVSEDERSKIVQTTRKNEKEGEDDAFFISLSQHIEMRSPTGMQRHTARRPSQRRAIPERGAHGRAGLAGRALAGMPGYARTCC